MNIYRTFDETGTAPGGTILTVGTFDGVHRGHRLILERLLEEASAGGMRAMILTIDPHPQIVLKKEGRDPVRLLTSIDERLMLFGRFGIEHVLVIPFTYEFSRTDPETFVRQYLHGKLGMKKFLVGYDHMFGKNREGNEDLLKDLSGELDFEVEKIEPYYDNGVIISSTRIRNALKENDLGTANSMLGYDYFVLGRVVVGARRGSTLGYPTANIQLPDRHKQLPVNGIYFVSSQIDGQRHFGMANIGTRPTFTDDTEPTLEVYYFDFDLDIYGKDVSVVFHNYIRPEIKFPGAKELIEKMKSDELICRGLIKNFIY